MSNAPLPIHIPRVLLPLLKPKLFKSVRGGRGSGKSHTVATLYVAQAYAEKHRILCAREIQKSIRASVKTLIEDKIAAMGLDAYFDSKNERITCLRTGSTFEFTGLREHTVDTVKSMEGVTRTWVEEAHKVSKRSWTILLPTVLRTPNAEVWATWNPDLEEDEIWQMTQVRPIFPREHMLDIECNYSDNKWFPELLKIAREQLLQINKDLHDHVYGGKLRSAAGLLFKRKWFDDAMYDPHELPQNLIKYIGTDYASADIEDLEEEGADREPDWTESGVWGMDSNGHLWALDWYSGQTDPEKWISAIVKQIKKYKPSRYFEESGVIYRSTKGAFNKKMREQEVYVLRTPLPSTGSKADRALGFAAYAGAGKVHFPRNVPWAQEVIDQLCSFTGLDGRVDDKADACSKLAQGLDNMVGASVPAERKRRIIRPMTEEHFAFSEHDQDEAARARREYNES